mgnify:CR=1 FL=1
MVSFSLPAFITGLEVSNGLQSSDAMLALVAGSLIIVIVGAVMGAIGAYTRLSSYLLVRIAFGDAGARLVNMAFAISLLGWFGVNINLFTNALGELTMSVFGTRVSDVWLAIVASACMTATTLVGFRAINILSSALVPILAIVTVLLAWSALEMLSFGNIMALEKQATLTIGEGISAIVGSIIVGAIILPDITRFVRHWSGAVYTAIIAYIVVQVAVMGSATLAGSVSGKTDILEILLDVNLGFGAFVIVIAGSWVLNSLNLYSAVLSTKASFVALKTRPLTLALGATGVVAALMNILDSFLTFLFYLSVVFIPVAGVIIVDFFLVQREAYQVESLYQNRSINIKGVAAWSIGALYAVIASTTEFPSLTQIAAIDAVLLSAVTYFVLSRFGVRSPIEKAQ